MKKNRVIALVLSIIMIVGFAVSCSNEAVKVEDQLAYVSFGDKGSRSFATGISEAPGVDSLYWTYDAVKVGGGLNTGAGEGITFSGIGIAEKQVGPFSVGNWKFTLKGYAEEAHTTLVYSGTSDVVNLSAGTNNPINVDVVYQAKGGKGEIVVDKAYLDYSGTEAITKLQIELVNTADNTNTTQWVLTNPTTNTERKYQFSKVAEELSAGVYKATFAFFTGTGESEALALPAFVQYIIVLNNRTTTISGCISEDQALNQTFNVTTKDEGFIESAGKYYVYVKTEQALQNAMNAAGVSENENSVVVLTGDIETESITLNSTSTNTRAITVGLSNSVTLDLNGFNLKKSANSTAEDLITMSAPNRVLIIKNSRNTGSIDAGNSTVANVTSGKLIIESGEVKGGIALKVEAGAEATISGGNLIGSSVAIKNGGKLQMNGGKITAVTAIEVINSAAITAVESGTIDADNSVSKDSSITGTVEVSITDDVAVKEGATTSNDIILKRYTGTGRESDPYCVGSLDAIKAVMDLDDGLNTKYVKVIKDFDISETLIIDTKSLVLYLNGHTISNNCSQSRMLNIIDSSISIIGGNGCFIIPEDFPTSYGFINIKSSNSSTTVKLEELNLYGNTDDGAFIKISSVDAQYECNLVLNGITGETNNRIQHSDSVRGLVKLEVIDSIFSSGKRSFCVNSYNTSSSACFKNVIATSDEGPIIELDSAKGSFDNCTFEVTNLKYPEVWYSVTIGLGYEGIANINSGTYTSKKASAIEVYTSGGTFNINGGTFAGVRAIQTYETGSGTINITGGKFIGELNINSNSSCNFEGGTFSTNPTAYVADNCIVAEKNGEYIVSKLQSRALTVDEKNTIDSSDLYVEGLEIYVIETGKYSIGDIVAEKMIFIPEDNIVELDLAGNKIKSTFAGFSIANCGELTISDSSDDKAGLVYNSSKIRGDESIYNITTENYYYGHDVVRNYGTLTINGGTFGDSNLEHEDTNNTTYGAAIRNQASGTVTINGGSFTCVDNYGSWDNNVPMYSYALKNYGIMTINDGTVYGKMNGGVSADGGQIIVNGGSVIIDNIDSWHTFTINTNASPMPTITITGGRFVNNNTTQGHLLSGFSGMPSWEVKDDLEGKGYYISGGTFIEDEQEQSFGSSSVMQ